jgi:hypothetical protein
MAQPARRFSRDVPDLMTRHLGATDWTFQTAKIRLERAGSLISLEGMMN